MNKLFKIGFWVLLLTTLLFFNFWTITKNAYEKDILKCKEINEKRIASLMTSNIVNSRIIRSFGGENIATREVENGLFQDKTLAILLSVFKCNKCQEKELRRLNVLKEKMKTKGVSVIGITMQAKKNEVAIQRKILKLDFPIYWVDDELFKKEISFENEYPQLIYVENNIILSCFIPVPMDDEFSEMFYSELLKELIKESQ